MYFLLVNELLVLTGLGQIDAYTEWIKWDGS